MAANRILILAAANFVVSSIGIAFAQSFPAFVTWRILGGMSIGLASNISPMYISEIAPPARRGLLVAINQLTIVIGVLAAQFVNWCIARPVPDGLSPAEFAASWNVVQGWRWMFAACAVPSVLFLVGSLFVPESPRWLTKAGAAARAERTLSRIGGADYAAAALAEIRATLVNEDKHVRLGELLERRVLVVLGLGIFLAVFQQWCGINVIFNYAGEIFKQAGYNINDTLTNIVMTGLVNFLFTFVALFTVDRLGRKPLMLFGAAGLALIYTAIGYCYHLKGGGLGRAQHAVPRAGAGRHRLLCDVPGARHLGDHLGDLPQPHSRHRHVHRGRLPLDRLLPAHLHLPHLQRRPRRVGHLLDLRRHLLRRICGHPDCGCPRPKARRSNRSRRSWWTEAGVKSESE